MPSLEEDFLWQTHRLIEQKLRSHCVDDFLASAQKNLKDISCYTIFTGKSKRARPLLCFAYKNLFNADACDKVVNIAAAAELIHCASLLHDDVIDNADKRRGQQSVNVVYGNTSAVLAGNFLLTQAFEFLSSFDKTIISEAISVIKKMSVACMKEVSLRKRVDVTLNDWHDIALGKTAELFSWCGFAVGKVYGSDADVESLTQLSKHIGFIFQMMDDLKDFDGDHDLKVECCDLKNQEASLPIILAAHKNSDNYKIFSDAFNKDFLSTSEIAQLKALVISSNALDETKKLVLDHMNNALSILALYPQSTGKSQLEKWLKELVFIELA